MQYLYTELHLECVFNIGMRNLLSYALAAVLAVISLAGCSAEENPPFEAEFDYCNFQADDATAYYYGPGSRLGCVSYRLELVQGRLNDKSELVSNGAMLCLKINAPYLLSHWLPVGHYVMRSGEDRYLYTFEAGVLHGGMIEGSYIGIMGPRDRRPTYIPVAGGEMDVTSDFKDQTYSISCRLISDGETYTFEYHGFLDTYDNANGYN